MLTITLRLVSRFALMGRLRAIIAIDAKITVILESICLKKYVRLGALILCLLITSLVVVGHRVRMIL